MKAGDALRLFCQEFGVPEKLTFGGSKEQGQWVGVIYIIFVFLCVLCDKYSFTVRLFIIIIIVGMITLFLRNVSSNRDEYVHVYMWVHVLTRTDGLSLDGR